MSMRKLMTHEAAMRWQRVVPMAILAICAMAEAVPSLSANVTWNFYDLKAIAADAFNLQRVEFANYYRQITGKDAPDGLVFFAIDPKVSKSGRDAYRIVSGNTGTTGVPPVGDGNTGTTGVPPVEDGSTGTTGVPPVERNGQDARCPSDERARCPFSQCVTITGSNMRSVWYGLYDLLERRGGCHWFWDGDVVPKRESIDLSNLDVHEEARFEYRGLRYFAHRGLTRFQAEQWGPDEWRREIDWLLKRRLNTFMLRIGQDDLFQRTFPESCPYPDVSKPQPGMYKGYNDRTLFWSLEYRGKLRQDVQKYASIRGLMPIEDFGTMSHWYSPTPDSFLADKNPPFLPQVNATHGVPHLRVWDIRDDMWANAYWKMTKTAIEAYGKDVPAPRLLHTIGLAERQCLKDEKANLALKMNTLNKFLAMAKRDYPDAKLLIASWDFYCRWSNEETRDYLKTLDKDRVILWDYTGDSSSTKRYFTHWDVIGKFPYTYSVFLGLNRELDARANYPLIEKRQKLVQDDPFCKGYIFWPESSHTDTLCLRFVTSNAWSSKPVPYGDVLDEFCTSRYGAHAAAMKEAWSAALPASWLRDSGSYADLVRVFGKKTKAKADATSTWAKAAARWEKPVVKAQKAFTVLQRVPWNDPFVQRDAIDIARMVLDRTITLKMMEFNRDLDAWRTGTTGVPPVDGKNLLSRAENLATLCDLMADVLALHTDFSLWESYQRLDAVEKIRNPEFSKTLFENASCAYCLSHQYEFARHWYPAHVRAVAKRLEKAIASGDRKADIRVDAEGERLALKEKPLESLKPTLPRTEENFRKVMREIEKHCRKHTVGVENTGLVCAKRRRVSLRSLQ